MSTLTPVASDPRVNPVEDNLLGLFRLAASLPMMTDEGHTDVVAYYSEHPIPLFNAISGATFVSGDRAREVLGAYVARGLPFMWWLTPSTSTGAIEAALAEAGLEPEHVPGMHRSLDDPVQVVLGPTVTVQRCAPDDFDVFMDVCLRGFEFPDFAREPMAQMLGSVDPTVMRHVVAYVDGTPAAAGSVYLDGTTAGLYNIATLASYRGHGLGYAVTAELLAIAKEAGASDAVLHASEMGKPVYERAGFVEVCTVPQWVWMPS